MLLPTIFTSLLGKIGLRIDNTRINSPSTVLKHTTISFGGIHLHDENDLKKYLLEHPKIIPKDLEINTSDDVVVTENVLKTVGSLQTTIMTNNPTKEELELVQLARDNRPYNTISDVHITYNEAGDVKTLHWTES